MSKIVIVQAYKADDGTLFEVKEKYQEHQRKLAAIRGIATKARRRYERQQAAILKIQEKSETFDELAEAVLKQWTMLANGSMYRAGRLTAMQFTNMQYSDRVSNTHSCPKSGVTNWYCESELPGGYPGWFGRIYIESADRSLFSTFDALSNIGIHPGSGGSGHYDVKIFCDDFPGLTKEIVWQKLST